MTFAGFPTAIQLSGIFLVTTLPPPYNYLITNVYTWHYNASHPNYGIIPDRCVGLQATAIVVSQDHAFPQQPCPVANMYATRIY